jgi:hypothetical protein
MIFGYFFEPIFGMHLDKKKLPKSGRKAPELQEGNPKTQVKTEFENQQLVAERRK